MATRTFKTQKAAKHQVKLKVNIEGPGGSGKTLSSLMLAYGLCGDWTKIFVVDTENLSANFYASKPYELTGSADTFNVVPLEAPYDPEAFIDAIQHCEKEGAEVIIVDNISHEWNGRGGVLEIVDDIKSRRENVNEMSPWLKMTPRHTAFIDKILFSPAHVICTVRCREEVAIEKDEKGKNKVVKVGLQPQQRDGYGFEFGLTFSIDMSHYVKATKDRTGLFMDREDFVIDIETGVKLKQWAESGNDLVAGVVAAFEAVADKAAFDELFQTSTAYLNIPTVKAAVEAAGDRIRQKAMEEKAKAEKDLLKPIRAIIKKHTPAIKDADLPAVTNIFKEASATGFMKEEYMVRHEDIRVFYESLLTRKKEIANAVPAEQAN